MEEFSGISALPVKHTSRSVVFKTNTCRRNWDTDVIRDMYRNRFIALAFAVVQHILVPRRFTAAARLLSSSTLMRATIELKEDASAAYTVFEASDVELGTTAEDMDDHGILYVTGSPVETSRTKKRPREEEAPGDEGDWRGGVFGALRRARRARAA
ncbi:hypothetical protein BKA63DRAFT_307590 [Paraphoma chrysanthemicola]|nr:hypothetical protein BKA63DRAFT_307590 [Paraphoma chrysanthemicola]